MLYILFFFKISSESALCPALGPGLRTEKRLERHTLFLSINLLLVCDMYMSLASIWRIEDNLVKLILPRVLGFQGALGYQARTTFTV